MSVNPSTGPGAQSGVNLVTTCVSPVGPGPIKGQQKSASVKIPPSHGATPSPTTCPVSALTPQPAVQPPTIRTKQELAFNLSDLDVICVVDDSGPTPRETGEGATKLTPEVVDLLNESSGSETDHSSDFSDETDMEENKDEQSVRGMVRLLKVVDEPVSTFHFLFWFLHSVSIIMRRRRRGERSWVSCLTA